MFTDMTGKRRLKACLHLHTTLSDGDASPEEAMAMYEKAGYDILAITDHYKYHPGGQYGAMRLISGAEYHILGPNAPGGVFETFHVVALDADRDPAVSAEMIDGPAPVHQRTREVVETIHAAGGAAILAHPAWSLNTPEEIMDCLPFDGTEIYNSVSSWTHADRAYSGLIADQLAMRGTYLPLLATDDSHFYAGEHMRGITMLEADAVEELGVGGAIRAGRFYATQGPEIHLERISDTHVKVRCTPASKIAFFSSLNSGRGRVHFGESLTEAVCPLACNGRETYIRAEVTDKDGRQAWSNLLLL